MSKPITIYLVDDHAVVRTGLKALIERLGNFSVTEQFDNGKELIDCLPFKDAPDLIIMDLNMPVMDGRKAMKQLKEKEITTPVLILTLEHDEKEIIELFRMGIRGYIPKSSSAEILRRAIEDIIGTGYYHNEILIKALSSDKKDERADTLGRLTERERKFVEFVCDENELTYDQIADKMGVSRRTVDGYREEIFQKFNIRSKTGLVLFAIKNGIINITANRN
jgi:two-component system, NarL family, invasion response regulator UvrY